MAIRLSPTTRPQPSRSLLALPRLLVGLSLGTILALGIPLLVPPLASAEERLVVYSGRAERLIKPVLDTFEARTGIRVDLLSSETTDLVNRLRAEGTRTQADVFITNEAGSLERARELGLLQPLKMEMIERVIPAPFRAQDDAWIGLSGRLWIIVYNPAMVTPTEITSILDLADPRWKGKIAIPQAGNEYLQAGVSVILAVQGHARTKAFLQGIKVNAGRRVYAKNSQIVDAVAKGQVALGLVNHYYIYRHLAEDSKAPIAPLLPDQAKDGMGTIMNASGVGVVRHTHRLAAAKHLVGFLMSQDGQKMFADLNKEYPLHPQVHPDAALPPRDSFHVAHVPLARLSELREPTTLLIEEVGLR